MKRRYFVREKDVSGFVRFFVFDAQTGRDMSGARFARVNAQAEADRLNGAMWRQEEEAS